MNKCLMDDISTLNYIYLLQEREFIKTSEPVFKVGRTQQINHERFRQYPKGSVLLFQMKCKNCHDSEKQILTAFKLKFIQRKDVGNEYFEGDESIMMDIIYQTIKSVDESVIVVQPRVFVCSSCGIKCLHYSDWKRHILTTKHKILTNNDQLSNSKITHVCLCGLSYKHLSGLSRHKKSCKSLLTKTDNNSTELKTLLLEMIKPNTKTE